MKIITIVKLLIVLAVINAAVRVGIVASKYYQLKDQSQQLVTFGAQASTGEIQTRIVERAQALAIPLEAADVNVTRDGLKTVVSAAYTQPVEVFPNYTYPINFRFSVDAISMAGLGQGAGQGQPVQ